MERPCLCFECFSTLYLFHKFKRRCLRVEEDLRLYLREKPYLEVVDLCEVAVPYDNDVVVKSPPVSDVEGTLLFKSFFFSIKILFRVR